MLWFEVNSRVPPLQNCSSSRSLMMLKLFVSNGARQQCGTIAPPCRPAQISTLKMLPSEVKMSEISADAVTYELLLWIRGTREIKLGHKRAVKVPSCSGKPQMKTRRKKLKCRCCCGRRFIRTGLDFHFGVEEKTRLLVHSVFSLHSRVALARVWQ